MRTKEEAVGNSKLLQKKQRLDLSMSMIINVKWITGMKIGSVNVNDN